MADDSGDSFLGRWSRRKVAARSGEPLPEPAAPDPPAAAAAPAAEPAPVTPPAPESPPELPDVESLEGLRSDYRAFLDPRVDAATRSAALRRLFTDPHFNVMDGLDVYIDDYSIPDPIPPAMLRALNQARTLGLFDEAPKDPEGGVPAVAATGEEPPAEPARETGNAVAPPPAPPDAPTKV